MNQLGLFAKFWELGKVKTRLAKSVGPEIASRIYRLFLQHLIEQYSASPLNDSVALNLVFSPPESRPEFAQIAPDWNLVPQSAGDLGQRMESCFRTLMAQSMIVEKKTSETNGTTDDIRKASAVIIGSDTPQLSSVTIAEAHENLANHDVVIGPSTDGGYYLIGINSSILDTELLAQLFEGIAWSTASVLPETIDRIERNGASYALLDPLTDIDELDDLKQLLSDPACLHDSLFHNLREIAGDFLS